MTQYNYLILLKTNDEASEWMPSEDQNTKNGVDDGEICTVLDSSGSRLVKVSDLNLENEPWVVVAYVRKNDSTKKDLANKLKGKEYRIFFHGGSANVGGGIEAIKQSFEKNYGGCGFAEEYMYFSSGSNFPANEHIKEVQKIFSNGASK